MQQKHTRYNATDEWVRSFELNGQFSGGPDWQKRCMHWIVQYAYTTCLSEKVNHVQLEILNIPSRSPQKSAVVANVEKKKGGDIV